jgi:predicted nucleic acid-binding protein
VPLFVYGLHVVAQIDKDSEMNAAHYELEEQAEATYRAAVAAHHAAWKSGVEIGYAEIDAAKAVLLSIRDRAYNSAELMASAKWDAAERNRLMLDDA